MASPEVHDLARSSYELLQVEGRIVMPTTNVLCDCLHWTRLLEQSALIVLILSEEEREPEAVVFALVSNC